MNFILAIEMNWNPVYRFYLCTCWTLLSQSVVYANSNTNDFTVYLNSATGDFLPWIKGALLAEKDLPGGSCPESPGICPPSKFRDPSGVCNNVRHPLRGSSGMPFDRFLPPNYSDGISTPAEYSTDVRILSEAANNRGFHSYLTGMVGVWGNLIYEDISLTFNPDLDCCKNISKGLDVHQECFVLGSGSKCQNYARSAPALRDCSFRQREQMNLVSSYLDGSGLYGDTIDEMIVLRGPLKQGKVDLRQCKRCHKKTPLSSLYSILLHHHNHLATSLSDLNPHWDDEKLFHETRRIVISEIQHITYSEFLPLIMGDNYKENNYNDYSSQQPVEVFNEVATSVLPVFQTMIPNVTDDSLEYVLENLLISPAKVSGISAKDLQRTRDHGTAYYHHYQKICGNSTELPSSLKNLYRDGQAVDLAIGGLYETPLQGALFGPTFSCLLHRQLDRTRKGDRFWYENDIPPSSLSRSQLNAIRRINFASVLCESSSVIKFVQPHVFLQQDTYLNNDIGCEFHNKLDLTPWKSEAKSLIPDELIMQAVSKAEEDVAARRNEEYKGYLHRGGVDPKSPVGIAAAFSKATKEALNMANTSLLFEFATEELLTQLQSIRRRRREIFDGTGSGNFLDFPSPGDSDFLTDISDTLQGVDLSNFVPGQKPEPPPCLIRDGPENCDERSPFRTISGYCNNLKEPHLGKSLATFARLMPPAYENGISKPRLTSVSGRPLPSPRLVSTMIHADISNLHGRYSLMLMQFAQFLDHDLTFTPVHKGFFTSIPDCRPCDSSVTVHPECMPIQVPRGDPYYPQVNQTSGERVCLPFMRSLPGQQQLGPREQINQNSAFLDAGHIYGEHECQGRELRSGFGGRLNVTRHPVRGKDLLPQSPLHPECRSRSGYCFIAGDGRASEQVALTAMHTVWMRQHNRVAEGLQAVNPHWDDELLYQHARKITGATWQHLVFNEFLPRLLGWNVVNLYDLKLRPQGYYSGYSDSCNPNILNEFAAAAFRIGHSLLRPHIPRMTPNYQPVDPPLLLRDGFFNPDIVYQPHMVDEVMRGLISVPVETLDQFITGEITNHLFEDRRIPHSGIDLAALNVQRGRDHAIRSYNDYRGLCNLKRAVSFEDLAREIPQEVIARLKTIYPSVDDIDLFPGGMSERPVAGGLVGPTFACIIAIQFRQLRKCDRFWYETDNPVTKFTEPQLNEIRKITLSKVLCENMDHVGEIQRSTLDQPSGFLNPRVPCQSIPDIDLNAWKEGSAGCNIGGRPVPVGGTAVPTPCTSCVCTAQGPQCASLRITDCQQLQREWSKEAIIRDDVCTTQCGFLLRDTTTLGTGVDSEITFTTRGPPKARRLRPSADLVPPVPKRLRPPGFNKRPPVGVSFLV